MMSRRLALAHTPVIMMPFLKVPRDRRYYYYSTYSRACYSEFIPVIPIPHVFKRKELLNNTLGRLSVARRILVAGFPICNLPILGSEGKARK